MRDFETIETALTAAETGHLVMSTLHTLNATETITGVQPNKIRLRGYAMDQLMGKISFSQAIYLVLKGELPSPEVGRLWTPSLFPLLTMGRVRSTGSSTQIIG
jgi:citrate synthase